jgi:hypothetical protein
VTKASSISASLDFLNAMPNSARRACSSVVSGRPAKKAVRLISRCSACSCYCGVAIAVRALCAVASICAIVLGDAIA